MMMDPNDSDGGGYAFENHQLIVEPGEKDVLCGRGGMSNHHQGNEWYRRLIRSNRPLYRACPKHTKLLVSKAIVQAVEEQGGRFLEKSRKSGLWYIVPYKRAVDKTSQGLREKDKDDAGPKITNLPASLRGSVNGGKPPKPNLSDLAQITMSQAGMPLRAQKPPSQPLSKIARHQHQQQQQRRPQQQQPMMANPQMQAPATQRGSFGYGVNPSASMATAAVSSAGPLDEPPPQPGLLSSQSSMFRIFSRFGGGGNNNGNQSPMGGGSSRSSWSMGFGGSGGGGGMSGNNSNTMQMMNNNMSMGMNNMGMNPADPSFAGPMNHQQQQMQMQQEIQMQQELQMQQEMQRQQMQQQQMQMQQQQQQRRFQQQQQQRMQQQQQQMRMQQQQQQDDVPAPSLTRLTTQVSDWLTSFWPVNKPGGGGVVGAPEQPNDNNMARASAGSGMRNQMQQQRRMNSNRGSLQQQQQMVAMMNANKNNGNGRGRAARLPPADLDDDNDDDAGIPPPARRLESSVSTTLLKLASTPTKIFAGISTFLSGNNNEEEELPPVDTHLFDDVNDDDDDNIPPPPAAAGLGVPVGRPSSRRDDLLDDYEESPMEARLRAIGGSS